MFESLSEKLGKAFKFFRNKGKLTEAEKCFQKAIELGGAEAANANLEELRKKREDNRAFGIEE